jgi:hypothetical protein
MLGADFVRFAVIPSLAALVTVAIYLSTAQERLKSIDLHSGEMSPSKVGAAFSILLGLYVCACATRLLVPGVSLPTRLEGVSVIVLGVAIAGLMAPSLMSIHAVKWSDDGVEGPAMSIGPMLGFTRTTIAWPDIRRTGKTLTGYWFIEDGNRRRVYWHYLYRGHERFAVALECRCSGLALPK